MNQWISVNDRLPEQKTQVIIILANGEIRLGYLHDCLRQWYESYTSRPLNNAVYWMPLAEPPTHTLKPCPFCGAKPAATRYTMPIGAKHPIPEDIKCQNPRCAALVSGPAEKWNQRADLS